MKLFFFTAAINLKTAQKTVAIPFFVLLIMLLFGFLMLEKPTGQQVKLLSMAVENNDTHPIGDIAIEMLISDPSVGKAVEVTTVERGGYNPNDYNLVMVLPEGFVESILQGKNLSPSLTVNGATPIEQLMVAQLAAAAESYCSVFQASIYAVTEAARQSGMPPDKQDSIVLAINAVFLRQFIDRLKVITPKITDPYGTGGPAAFLIRGALAMLLLAYSGVAASALMQSLGVARALVGQAVTRRSRTGSICFAAGYLTSALVLAVMTAAALPVLAAAGTRLKPLHIAVFLVLAVSFGCCAALAAGSTGGGVTASLLLVLPMGLLSGCLLPPELLPPSTAALAPFTVTHYGQALLNGRNDLLLPAALVALALTVLSAFLWKRRVYS